MGADAVIWLAVTVAALLVFCAGFLFHAFLARVLPSARAGTIDLTAAAARGDLIELDWSDRRRSAIGSSVAKATGREAGDIARAVSQLENTGRLRAVVDAGGFEAAYQDEAARDHERRQ